MITCPRCQAESPDGYRFCGACGSPLPEAGEPDRVRKLVTILFCDMADSTALGERLDPEVLSDILSRYFADVSAIVLRHGGTVQKYAGDAVLAVFGIPQVHEDDPLRALRAAIEIRDRAPALAEQLDVALRVRIGINTGLVITDEGKSLALGDPVNLAARLEQAAQPGEILLGAQTLALVRDAVEVEPLAPLTLKGKSEPVQAYRLVWADRRAPGVARRLEQPLVNRRQELAALSTLWQSVRDGSGARLVTLTGSAGVGKSRLAEQLLSQVGEEARVMRGRCLHYGEGITFWPLTEALAGGGEDTEQVLRHLSEGGAGTVEELFLEVRLLLETLASEQPLILYIDDLHWGEPMLIDLLAHTADHARGSPILILSTARPELLEEQPDWAGRPRTTIVALDPLVASDCERLLEQLGADLDREARERVIRTSEGNPLFVEEMVELAREQGAVQVPLTIQSLLSARIERLDQTERELLARGAVAGEVFDSAAVRALGQLGTEATVDDKLLGLVRKDLIRPYRPDASGGPRFRFKHLLIRDVAYERLSRARRAELHERFADWIEANYVHVPEHEELAGWHLEQAVRDREQTRRPLDIRIMLRAAQHLQAAARRAAGRADLAAAEKLLERALALAPHDDPVRVEVAVSLAERLIEVGNLERADQLLSLAEQERPEDPLVALNRCSWLLYLRPAEAFARFEQMAPGMRAALALNGDDRGLAAIYMLGFWMQWMQSRAAAAAEQARLAADHAGAAGDMALRSRALGWYIATLIFGPTPADEMTLELDRIAAEEPGPYLQAFLDHGCAEVHRLAGRYEQAAELTLRARDGFRALEIAAIAATSEQSLGWVELWAGDPAGARASLLRSDAILAEFGEHSVRSTTQALLALAELQLGNPEAARSAAAYAEELSSPTDAVNFAITHEVRARLALAAGQPEEAERWGRSAVDYALATDFIIYQAQARLALAEVLVSRGQFEGAAAEAQAAAELLDAKGERPGAARARRQMAEIDALRG